MACRSKKVLNPKLLCATELSAKVKSYYEQYIRGKVKNQALNATATEHFTTAELCALLASFTSELKHGIVPLVTHEGCVKIYLEMFTAGDGGYGNLKRVGTALDPTEVTIRFNYMVDVVMGNAKRDAKGAKRTRDDQMKHVHDAAFHFAKEVYGQRKPFTDKQIRDLNKGIRAFGLKHWETREKVIQPISEEIDETLTWLRVVAGQDGAQNGIDVLHAEIEAEITALTGII